ncbi:DNA ligase/mRNA capping enzyme [Ramaria rubella]|nr:DNA ligase/mRNA capping enzyme [Ramaria rubella]
MATDELNEINGIKPKRLFADGEEVEAPSMTSNSVYKVKRTYDHFYCTCPAWRNQSAAPINARTCKHIRSILGDAYEDARLEFKNPDGVKANKKKSASKARKPLSKAGKRKRGDDDDDEDDNDEARKKKPASTRGSKMNKDEDDDDEDEDEEDNASKKKAPPLLLANSWKIDGGQDVVGWWASEKLDGVRVFYDGKQMISRLGNPFTPPKDLLAKLPRDITLDGELFGGRGKFQDTVSVVKTINSPHWQSITFQVFDVPSKGELPFEDRMAFLQTLFGPSGSHASPEIQIVEQTEVQSREQILEMLKDVESKGGEGLMLRKPESVYEGRRSSTLLKIKSFYDAEARVTGYEPGKGRNKGTTGALKCVMESGKKFNVGTGLSDKQRKNPPKIGSIVVYRFQELTRDGVPRFPSFIGEAADKTEPKDADVPDHRKAGATGPK